uniref:F-box domain-containing protein n=1 Tax=Leersia perrieri TaxID=77586 RepID=A0A0D9XQ98_9ORYZ
MPTRETVKRGKRSPPPSGGGGGGDEDRIGDLPDGILHHILGFLPATEAVRTCVLARRWRHLWKSVSTLRIANWDFSSEPVPMEEFKYFVHHLLLHRGRAAPIDDSISTGVSDRDTRRVNRWFRHALMRQARLRLEFRWKTDFVLVLDNLPVVSRRLVKLVLTNVRLMHSFLDFSGCPVLEHLKLWRCDLSDAKRISSQSLKRITTFRCDFSDVFQTQICVPNLLTLYLCYYTNLSPVFEVVPLLTEALVGVTDGSGDWSFYPRFGHGNCMLPEVITHAEKLRLGVESPISNAQDFNFQRYWQWCPTFSKLKTLSISQCISTYFDFEAICCILRHSPVLEELALDFDEDLNIKWKLKDATISPTVAEGTGNELCHIGLTGARGLWVAGDDEEDDIDDVKEDGHEDNQQYIVEPLLWMSMSYGRGDDLEPFQPIPKLPLLTNGQMIESHGLLSSTGGKLVNLIARSFASKMIRTVVSLAMPFDQMQEEVIALCRFVLMD